MKALIEEETEERRVRSIQYQMRIAKFPHHKDFATCDHGAATVTKSQIDPFRLRKHRPNPKFCAHLSA